MFATVLRPVQIERQDQEGFSTVSCAPSGSGIANNDAGKWIPNLFQLSSLAMPLTLTHSLNEPSLFCTYHFPFVILTVSEIMCHKI